MSDLYNVASGLKTKLTELLTGVTVTLQQTRSGLMNLPDEAFPRIEMPYIKQVNADFGNRKQREKFFVCGITGYIRRTNVTPTDEDLQAICDFQAATENAVFSLETDKAAGTCQIKGFAYVSPDTEVHVVHEMEPRIDSFMLLVTISVISNNWDN